jgi:secreted PhoX family phosphatase
MTPPEAPVTQTITLNAVDNPVIIYAGQDEHGDWHWAFRVNETVAADRERVKTLLLDLNRNCVAWFDENYGWRT